ncbi:MAG: hypothetical protein JO322_00365 [Candidatus Eremiobacteraeota bacterium]|nr:hypothetical protein [Candidatus Eremiobacteraeota bacterium]
MLRSMIAGAALIALTACSSPPPAMPENATAVGAVAERSFAVPMSSPGAPPVIVHIDYMPSVSRGPQARFAGRIWASSNVASVEVRTNLFSINATKRGIGTFTYDTSVYDLPPIFIRAYRLRVIARTTAGVEAEEDLPFRIR